MKTQRNNLYTISFSDHDALDSQDEELAVGVGFS